MGNLVLTRKVGERVVIRLADGRLVTVEVLEIDRGRVRLDLSAPREIVIHREEVWLRIQEAKGTT